MSTPEQIARIRISLAHITPEIWRRVEVPLGLHLKGLHDVIQAVFDWEDCHLFQFRIGEKIYGVPAPGEDYGRRILHAKAMRLATLVAKGIERFDYIYDLGDRWEHVVAIEAIHEADPAKLYPRFVDGARRGPPEDAGGPPSYEHYVAAMADRRRPDHREMLEWRGGPYDPEAIDFALLHFRLAGIVQRREIGRAAFEKSRLPR